MDETLVSNESQQNPLGLANCQRSILCEIHTWAKRLTKLINDHLEIKDYLGFVLHKLR